jgi:predicted house-cleaning noncanonical NTP pyrophosphatase (MazG superfamily)
MPRFVFNKLVRDQVLERSLSDPKVRTAYRTLDEEEYKKALVAKIIEEAKEIPTEKTKNEEIIFEIADVQTVLDSLKEAYGITDEEVRGAMDKKYQKNGSFEKRAFIEYVDLDDDSEWVEHFRASPDKYEELK